MRLHIYSGPPSPVADRYDMERTLEESECYDVKLAKSGAGGRRRREPEA